MDEEFEGMRLVQVAETNTPQPKDVAGEVSLYDEFMAIPARIKGIEIRIICLEVKDGNTFKGAS